MIKGLCKCLDGGDKGWDQGDGAQDRDERPGGVDNI